MIRSVDESQRVLPRQRDWPVRALAAAAVRKLPHEEVSHRFPNRFRQIPAVRIRRAVRLGQQISQGLEVDDSSDRRQRVIGAVEAAPAAQRM